MLRAAVHCHRALEAGKDKPILLPHVLRDLLEEIAEELNSPSLRDSAFSKYLAACQEVALLPAQPELSELAAYSGYWRVVQRLGIH